MALNNNNSNNDNNNNNDDGTGASKDAAANGLDCTDPAIYLQTR